MDAKEVPGGRRVKGSDVGCVGLQGLRVEILSSSPANYELKKGRCPDMLHKEP